MTIEEALITALDLEHRVRDHYARASERTDDPAGKNILIALAVEEQNHVDYISTCLTSWRRVGKLSAEALETIIPAKEIVDAAWQKLTKLPLNKDYTSELKMLRDALRIEREVGALYMRMSRELDGDARAIFSRFVEVEEGHEAAVRAQIDALLNKGQWCDFLEASGAA